jgi:hypothetical protein
MDQLPTYVYTFLTLCLCLLCPKEALAQDRLNLGEAYVNLSLTIEYYDSLETRRIEKILAFEKSELESIQDSTLIEFDNRLFSFSRSQWHYLNTKVMSAGISQPTRQDLLSWKNALEPAIVNFPYMSYGSTDGDFYEFIKFDRWSVMEHESALKSMKHSFTPLFNKDIYPDFKRIFLAAKLREAYHFDSLKYYCDLYNIPIDAHILNEQSVPYTDDYYESLNTRYSIASALDLISRFMQLDYIANGNVESIDTAFVYNAYYHLIDDLDPGSEGFGYESNEIIPKDEFFKSELNDVVCQNLYDRLRQRYPFYYADSAADGIIDYQEGMAIGDRYYFPTPAPFPTAKIAIKNFKPELHTLRAVDDYVRKCFYDAGYAGRLHYFYIRDTGYAVTTSIERINKNGTPASVPDRWDLRASGEDGLSLYEVFKAMFFKTESDYRLIACIVSRKEIMTTDRRVSLSVLSDMLENSYSSLPKDLEKLELREKTVTVLVYHYTQNEIGMVPTLNQNTILTAYDHLNNTTSLSRLTTP